MATKKNSKAQASEVKSTAMSGMKVRKPSAEAKAASAKDASDPSNGRAFGRVRCEMTTCDIGEVLDASAAGMRIRSRWKTRFQPGDVVTLKVEGTSGPFEVQARVIWAKRKGFMRYEVGVSFVDVPKEVRSALNMIAQAAASNLTYETSMRRKAS